MRDGVRVVTEGSPERDARRAEGRGIRDACCAGRLGEGEAGKRSETMFGRKQEDGLF